MPIRLTLPSWLPQTLLVKIGIYAGVGLAIFLWWRADRAAQWEKGCEVGIVRGGQQMEKIYKAQWAEAAAILKKETEAAAADRQRIVQQVVAATSRVDTVIARLGQLTNITLTMDERQKAYVEAHAVPPDQLDGALLLLTRELDAILAKQSNR